MILFKGSRVVNVSSSVGFLGHLDKATNKATHKFLHTGVNLSQDMENFLLKLRKLGSCYYPPPLATLIEMWRYIEFY